MHAGHSFPSRPSFWLLLAALCVPSLNVARAEEAPAGGTTAAAAAPASSSAATDAGYQLLIRDQIQVTVFDEPDLTVTARIDSQGQVRLALIENVKVAGLTVREAEEKIAREYIDKRFLKHPMVTIRVVEYSNREVTVQGQVMNPGIVQFPIEVDRMDIVEVIAKCGGMTELAKGREVRITRPDAEGKDQTRIVDVESMYRKGTDEKVYVLPGDRIYIPRAIF